MAGTRLFVGNLPYVTTEQELRELFERSGAKVDSVRLVTDLDTQRSKGYAFVELASAEEASRVAQEFDGFNLNGRKLTVNAARGRPTRPAAGRPGPKRK
jgi:RNA recognition motif-containing protein